MHNLDQSPRLTSEGILQKLQAHRRDLRKLGVLKIGLFGSYRRGSPHSESDMDFLIVLERPSFDNYMDLKFLLEDMFSCKVDLVMEDTIKPRLRPYILKEVIYAQGL